MTSLAKYHVEPFIKPVAAQPERHIEAFTGDTDDELMLFRQSRSASPVGDWMRECLGL